MKVKKIINRITKVFVIVGMILSLCMTGSTTVKALDTSVPKDFTAGKQINYPWWWSKKIGSNKAWSTNFMHYNGKVAYCLEASKNTPADQKYPAQVIDNNEAVRKLLYYGFGGPGYNSNVKKMYQDTLTACVPDDFSEAKGNWDDGAYLFTHIWLSYAYSGDLMGLNLDAFNKKWPNGDGTGYCDNLLWGYRWIMSQPDIGYATWNPVEADGVTAKLTAAFDPINKNQKTNTVKLEGTNAQANITLQDNVTLHNVTTGATQTGGTYVLNAGQSFYLTAPCKNSPSDYESGNVAGAGCERFTALAIHSGNSFQSIGSWEKDPDEAELYYSVDWLDFGALRLSKVDNTSNFQKNSKFRLVSTSYNGYDETFEVTKDADGDYELLVDYLPVGTYSLTEVDCEDYFAPTVAQWQVTVVKDKTTKKIVVNTLRPTGTLDVQKTLEAANEDATDLADHDITKTKYQVIAADNIIDTVSLKQLYAKGDVVTLNSGKCIIDTADGNTMTYSQGVQVSKGKMDAKGNISVDENGQLELTGLPLGKYQVVETECPKGYVLDQTPYDFTITQKDYTTTVYTVSHNQNNKITKTKFSKTDVTGEQEVVGAKMSVTDEDGHVIDEWISDGNEHEIDGLDAGKIYYLNENESPTGYIEASSIEFKVNEDGEIQRISMVDAKVEMIKSDEKGNLLKGAEMTVTSNKTKNIVDKWVSGQHIFDVTDEMKSQLLRNEKTEGMYVDDEDSTVTYSILKNKDRDDYRLVFVKDGETTYTNIDINGDETTHMIRGLVAGEKYVLRETKTPKGYATFKEKTFTAKANENVALNMTDEDTKIEISKQDITNNKELEGASLKVSDQDGKVIDEWISDKTPHTIKNLEVGKTYTLHETVAPQGYKLAQDIHFTIQDTGEIQKVVMYDELMPAVKTGDTSEENYYLILTVLSLCVGGLFYYREKRRL